MHTVQVLELNLIMKYQTLYHVAVLLNYGGYEELTKLQPQL